MSIKFIDNKGNPRNDSFDEKLALAKCDPDRGLYWVRVNGDGLLFEPGDMTSSLSKGNTDFTGNKYVLKACNKTCYEYYSMYLRTHNHTHMVIAQRSFSNG